MKFFSILRALVATTAIGALAGCGPQPGSQPAAPSNSAIDRIQSRGEMLVGYLVWEPCVLRDQRTGELSGIFPDMVAQIAKNLNVKVVWKETTLANFAAGLNTGQFDFSVGATFVTIPRAASVKFTQPVAYVGNSAVVKKDGSLKPQRMEELNKPGIKVALLQGQALEEFCRRNLAQAQLVVLSGGDLTAPLIAVSSGQADIGFMNSVTVAKYVAEHPELEAVFSGEHAVEILPLAWATTGSDSRMCDFLNASITYLKATGRLAEYQKKQQIGLLYDTPRLHPAE
jgi:polar amino acid transport system substrate-binding protein